MRARVGWLLRRWADRIDADGAYRELAGWSFTYEMKACCGAAVKFREDGRGCPVWYVGTEGFDRSFTESDYDWRSPDEKLAAMLDQFGNAIEQDRGKPARAYGGVVLPPQPMPYDPAADGPIIRLREDQ